ncbi:unnamed protein product [Gulo gulo]|uniref:Uncharacterized protein n=1 Tax=Gulo gulo TaxID=48420 RepID=A0A9X9LCW6_GULGU|nr:unnamed protein product [Gulo gulo]
MVSVSFLGTQRPESSFDKVNKRQNSTYTLSLPDIEVKESLENLIEGRKTSEPSWNVNENQAAQQLLEIVQNQRI